MDGTQSTTWFKVLEVKELPKGRGRIVRAGTRKVALFKAEGRIYAIDNLCPHAGASLGLGQQRGLVVICSRHNWAFNLETGRCVTTEGYQARTYPVRLRGGWIEVEVPVEEP